MLKQDELKQQIFNSLPPESNIQYLLQVTEKPELIGLDYYISKYPKKLTGPTIDVFNDYQLWCEDHDFDIASKNLLTTKLSNLQIFIKYSTNSIRIYYKSNACPTCKRDF